MKPGWQEWSKWTRCNNGQRMRTRSCIPSEADDPAKPPSCPSGGEEETEKQLCFTAPNMDEHHQKLSSRGPHTVEHEIASIDLKRPKVIRHEPIGIVEIRRD